MSEWFRRTSKNIKTFYKRDTEQGSWLKCPSCGEMSYRKVLEKKFFVCSNCDYHFRISSELYIKLLIDDNEFIEYGKNITSKDPLNFKMPDKSYAEQIDSYQKRTNKKSAVTILKGKINNREIVLGVMDFSFIGGSMGSVVGHKLGMAIDLAKDNIRVNTVCPTFVLTPMVKGFFKNKKFRKEAIKKIPLGRVAEESDVATAVAFLAADSSAMITGTSLVVDGGWTAQ